MRPIALGLATLFLLMATVSATGHPLGPGNFDQGWLHEGFTIQFSGAGFSRGPIPPTPADAWDPAGWSRFTATVTDVSGDVVTVRFETCMLLQEVSIWEPPAERCSTTAVAYSRATRESLDGTHCSVLWVNAGERGNGICLGKGTANSFSADATHVSYNTGQVDRAATYTYDGLAGLLVVVEDMGDGEAAQRVSPPYVAG